MLRQLGWTLFEIVGFTGALLYAFRTAIRDLHKTVESLSTLTDSIIELLRKLK
jgi:hypothetical protein